MNKNDNLFFLFLLKNDCGYTLEPPHWGGSNEYLQLVFYSKTGKICIHLYKPVLLNNEDVGGSS